MVLQFGTGAFIRGFFDVFVQEASDGGQPVEPIVAVQSTASNRADLLKDSGGRFHVAIRGLEGAEVVDRLIEVRVIEQALRADRDWDSILALMRSGVVSSVISNATESSYAFTPGDCNHPASFPARLAAVLLAAYDSGAPVRIYPCELVEKNAEKLRSLVLRHLMSWGTSPAAVDWVSHRCQWVNTLVDRITPGHPSDHPMAEMDPLLVMTEPYAYWGLETDALPIRHPCIFAVHDVQPFFTRKVRILNGLHSALVAKALPLGFQTVAEAMADASIADWLERVAYEEIVPTLEEAVESPGEFAAECFVRFRNPYFAHRLASIAAGHDVKVQHRIMPTIQAYQAKFGKKPPLLSAALEVAV